MKRIFSTLGFVFLILIMTACNQEPICPEGQIFNPTLDKCEYDLLPDDPEPDFSNALSLNTGNLEGWILETGDDSNPEFVIADGILTYTQDATSVNELVWDSFVSYDNLTFDGTYDYELSFDVTGSSIDTIVVQFTSGDGTIHEQSVALTGALQAVTMVVSNPITTENGILKIGFGLVAPGASVTIKNIQIIEVERVIREYNILFIGNSFTYYNDMPTMVKNMGLTNDYVVHVEQIAYGGSSLIDYATVGSDRTNEVIDIVKERQWDYVILQDHSRGPLDNKTEFLSAVRMLTEFIHGKDAEVILYSTWSYRDGSDKLATTGLSYTAFYEVLRDAYQEGADTYNTLLAPVGTAFYHLTMDQVDIELLVDDDFHPTPAGSYVAAYIFYTIIFGDTNNNNYQPSGVTVSDLSTLRQYALNAISELEE